jgi:hypothetical protein
MNTRKDLCQRCIIENFIQISYGSAPYSSPVGTFAGLYDWENYDCLMITSFSRTNYNNLQTKDLLVEMLCRKRYIFTGYDRFFVPGFRDYQTTHFNHDVMIIGFDSHHDSFLCADYVKTNYQTFEVRSEYLCQSIAGYSCSGERELAMDDIHCIEINEQVQRPVNYDKIKRLLTDFLTGYTDEKTKTTYGISFFDHLYCMLMDEKNEFDLTIAFQLLCEHMRLMILRAEGFQKNTDERIGPIISELKNLYTNVCAYKNIYFKYAVRGNSNRKGRTLACPIRSLKEQYIEVLLRFLELFQ